MITDGPVVIALDGSPHSPTTLDWGLTAASLRGADVLLARVFRLPRSIVEWSWYPVIGEDLALDTEAKQYTADTVEQARERYPAVAIDTRLLSGPEVPQLRRLSEQAQLLVVGARGHAGRVRIGSISAHLAAHARCPVAIVRADDRPATAPRFPVVVGVDGSPTSLVAAQVAAREASVREVPLVVVHARPTTASPYGEALPPLAPLPDGVVESVDPTHAAAHTAAEALRAGHAGLDVSLVLVDGEPSRALVRTACSWSARADWAPSAG